MSFPAWPDEAHGDQHQGRGRRKSKTHPGTGVGHNLPLADEVTDAEAADSNASSFRSNVDFVVCAVM